MDCSSQVKAACEELGVKILAYSPLAQGVLTGKYRCDVFARSREKGTYSEGIRSSSLLLCWRVRRGMGLVATLVKRVTIV